MHSGGSKDLVRQTLAGAQCDLLILAEKKMAQDELAPQGYTIEGFASNSLVVIAPASATVYKPLPFPQILSVHQNVRLAVADPETAPLGAYTASALSSLKPQPSFIPLNNASAVLSTVALGHAELGIVYATDARQQESVQVVSTIPIELYPTVTYAIALPANPTAGAKKLMDSLQHGLGQKILSKNGFLPLDE